MFKRNFLSYLSLCGAFMLIGLARVQALPEGWTITEFASPPQVEYPTALSAAANGDVYISVDRNGSLGKDPEFGKVVRATDTDGDGKADQFQDFIPLVHSPRGGDFVDGKFYLIHPPYLSSFEDTTGDGVADKKLTLVTGFGWGIEHPRGADHTTNGVRMGIDGWLYVAVGDFGMPKAKSADGTEITLWGGGVARVRPDGSEMEIYSYNIRNICDIAITPTMDMFARDNTNDGKGWNTRFHHFVPMGEYGYPRLYKNFPDETVMALKDFGGGSGTGALALNEPGFPEKYDNMVFTADWTTGQIYEHAMKPEEATFSVKQKVFHPLTRAIDLDVDGSSRMYFADWRNGRFRYLPEKTVGLIHQVLPPNWELRIFPDLTKMKDADLANQLRSDSAKLRLEAQQVILRRGMNPVFGKVLEAIVSDQSAHLFNRIAAIFTYKQLAGEGSHDFLVSMAKEDILREYCLRALADRRTQLHGVPVELFVKSLTDENPRVQVQAMNGLARLGAVGSGPAILEALSGLNPSGGRINETERRIVPHVGIQALVKLGALQACLDALEDVKTRPIAIRALQQMHDLGAVDGLAKVVEKSEDADLVFAALGALARLHYQEAQWDLEEWWHTRPDDRGPYYRPTVWAGTEKISKILSSNYTKIPKERGNDYIALLAKNRINIGDLKLEGMDPVVLALSNQAPDAAIVTLLTDAATDVKREWQQRALAFQSIGRAKPTASIPAQVKILSVWDEQKIVKAESVLMDFVNDTRRGMEVTLLNKIAKQGEPNQSKIAWKALLTVRQSPLAKAQFKDSVEKLLATNPMEVGLFLAIAEMKLAGFDTQIAAGIDSDNERTIKAAERAKAAGAAVAKTGKKVGELDKDEALAHALKNKGDVKNGERLYVSQGCIACHAISLDADQKGPYLGDSGEKFEREYLIESILQPNAVVAQGFQTVVFQMKDGTSRMGFVTNEADGTIDLRNISGQVSQILRDNVKEEQQMPQSMMPAGLGDNLAQQDFVDLIEYLDALKSQ